MTTGDCPSDLSLEKFLLAPGSSPVSGHLGACPSCAARLESMRAAGDEFRRFVFPATVGAVEDAMRPRRSRWKLLFAPAGALAAAAALALFLATPRTPPEDYLGLKGGPLGLAVYVNGEGGARALEDGAAVPAGAALRFTVRPEQACWLWLLSVDAAGQISRLYPPEGTAPERRAAGALPGGAVLDGQAGPERIHAVCAPDAKTSWAEIRAAAAAGGAGTGAERVRRGTPLGGALAGAPQASLLVEKRP